MDAFPAPLLRGLTVDQFLERLPLYASCVSRATLKDATDPELQAWAWGIEDVTENVKRLVAEWKQANAAEAAP
jgi:hypothetical protein